MITGLTPYLITLFIVISINDIVHKYAHMYDHERPIWASFLQKIYVFQSHEEHHQHHIYPHQINYCPISPFCNLVLQQIQFFSVLEDFIKNQFNVLPREKEYDFVEDPSYPAGIKFVP